jgi:hypothetical protein
MGIGRLDDRGSVADQYRMKCAPPTGWVLLLLLLMSEVGMAQNARNPVPPEVLVRAQKAVQDLGLEVRKGNYSFVVETMYGPWKSKEVRRSGGEGAFAKSVLVDIPRKMREQGIQITQFTAGRPTSAFEVRPVMKVIKDGDVGAMKEVSHYREWLVFVPTTRRCRISQAGKVTFVESTGYQAAVVTKGKNDWTFINGSGLSVDQLRGLFSSLPISKEQLGLPKVGPFVRVGSGTR